LRSGWLGLSLFWVKSLSCSVLLPTGEDDEDMTTGLVVKRTYGVFLLVWLFLVWFTGLVEFGLWDTVCRIPTNLAFLFRFCLAWFKLGLGLWCGDSVFFPPRGLHGGVCGQTTLLCDGNCGMGSLAVYYYELLRTAARLGYFTRSFRFSFSLLSCFLLFWALYVSLSFSLSLSLFLSWTASVLGVSVFLASRKYHVLYSPVGHGLLKAAQRRDRSGKCMYFSVSGSCHVCILGRAGRGCRYAMQGFQFGITKCVLVAVWVVCVTPIFTCSDSHDNETASEQTDIRKITSGAAKLINMPACLPLYATQREAKPAAAKPKTVKHHHPFIIRLPPQNP